MSKKISVFFLLGIFTFFHINANINSTQTIDFNKFPSIDSGYYTSVNPGVFVCGGYAFNYAPEITTLFAALKKAYGIDTVIETGTFYGGTTIVFSYLFDVVHTIELNTNNYLIARENLKSYKNINCHFGSSEVVINEILPSLHDKKILFYLDAHWNSYWPLLSELEEISKTHKDNCVIVIDDFKVPGRTDIPYDYYGSHECSLNYIKDKLDKIFTSYDVHYLIPKSLNSRAKAIIIPTVWTKNVPPID